MAAESGPQEIDFSKIPLEERALHKNWKARYSAYEELIKVFNRIEDENSTEWDKWAYLVKAFPSDPNLPAQEKGLEAVLRLMENSANHGPQIVEHILPTVLSKCLISVRTITRELATSVTLMAIEIGKQDVVQAELMKGMDAKLPKKVAGCVSLMLQSLREFGVGVIDLKQLLKKIPILLEDRDKDVREETKKLVVELFKWIGPQFKSQISSLKPLILTELEAEFEKVSDEKPKAIRFLKSEQNKKDTKSEDNTENDENRNIAEKQASLSDLIDPENILSKLPDDFYQNCESKKWQERKEALEALIALTFKCPKLEAGDYGNLVQILRIIIGKDINVVVVELAAKCMVGLAKGLGKMFSPYAAPCIETVLDKFKEKKPTVLTELKELADVCFPLTTLEEIRENVVKTLQSKNPNVKVETVLFLGKCFSKGFHEITQKKTMQPYISALVVSLNDSDPRVRDGAAEALGICLKVNGEKFMRSFFDELDASKMQKIKEFADNATGAFFVKPAKAIPAPTKEKQILVKNEATIKTVLTKATPKLSPTKPVATPNCSPKKLIVQAQTEKMHSNTDISEADDAECNAQPPTPIKTVGSPSSRVDLIIQLKDGLLDKLTDKDWSVRNEALDEISKINSTAQHISANLGDLPAIINQRFQDANRNIAAKSYTLCQNLAPTLGPHCKQHIRSLLKNILMGLGDKRANVRNSVIPCLNAWADHAGLDEFFQGEIIAECLRSKSPELRRDLFSWLAERLPETKNLKKEDLCAALPPLLSCVEDRNVEVRKAAQECVLPFMIHLGYEKMSLACGDLKPALRKTVASFLDKAKVKLSPKHTKAKLPSKPVQKCIDNVEAILLPKPTRKNEATKVFKLGPSQTPKIPVNTPSSPQPIKLQASKKDVKLTTPPKSKINYPDEGKEQGQELQEKYKKVEVGLEYMDSYGCECFPEFEPLSSTEFGMDVEMHSKVLEGFDTTFISQTKGQEDGPSESNGSPSPRSGSRLLKRTKSKLKTPKKKQSAKQVLSRSIGFLVASIYSTDYEGSSQALDALETIICNVLVPHEVLNLTVDALIDTVFKQIGRLMILLEHPFENNHVVNKPGNENLIKIYGLLREIYKHELGKHVSSTSLKYLIHWCLIVMDNYHGEKDKTIYNMFNSLVGQIIENSDPNALICALMNLLTDKMVEERKNNELSKVAELTIKCLVKVLKLLPTWSAQQPDYEFAIEEFILIFHIFARANPVKSFTAKKSSALKVMRLVIYNLVVKLGIEKFKDALNGHDISNSEGAQFIKKVIELILASPESVDTGEADSNNVQ